MILDSHIDAVVKTVQETMKDSWWKWYDLVTLDGVEPKYEENLVYLDFSHKAHTKAYQLRTGTGLILKFHQTPTKTLAYITTQTDDTAKAIALLGHYDLRDNVEKYQSFSLTRPDYLWKPMSNLFKWVCHRKDQDSKDIQVLKESSWSSTNLLRTTEEVSKTSPISLVI